MVVVADQSIREKKRPILVWIISAYYIYAFIWGLWASIPVIRGDVPVSRNPDSSKFIIIVDFLTTGLWFIASIFLIFLRKAAVSLFVAGLLAVARLLWKIEKAYSLGIPKKKLALGESQTEEEHAYGRKYTILWSNGRSFRA